MRDWFRGAFEAPTEPQTLGWPAIARGESTLVLAPTGSGKTLTAFLFCLDRLMFAPEPPPANRCRVLYISPLKALAVDVERNLRAPLAGIAAVARRRGDPHVLPSIAIRTGDTPQAERTRFRREPADILITTPESLYLLLTSNAREALRSVDTIIIDEIHALVPTKRGAHLAISLERLVALGRRPPQRIGLSATQRPLDEVARFLGGAVGTPDEYGTSANAEAEIADEFSTSHGDVQYRPVTIVDTATRKSLRLTIEVPVEDMARLTAADNLPSGPASVGDTRPSIWAAIHPRVLELVRAHRSTLVFVNSRRLAERLAGALNELAGETLVRSHHGSIARAQRAEVEELLKSGMLRGLVATSSLELGIDMGAIDLVVQIEAPPSVASGLQRIGRGGHQANATSSGIIFPKFRADLVACAAVAKAMHDGAVEATRYPRNPLDIVAQQVVAMTAVDTWDVDDLFATIRRAAPFAELSRAVFDSVLDMLSGRYPSDEFAELKPRVTWDRRAGTATARDGAKRVAIANGGTIPDRGLFGVFLAESERSRPGTARVGELDEEMVFETRVGEIFVLGASSWRIEEITHDRVLVSPAPGQPGKMPFWKGDQAGRPLELGLAIGRLTQDLLQLPAAAAIDQLTRSHDLDARAAENLLQYLRDQMAATAAVPDAATIVIERVRDELGDWRICVLSPRGGRVHAPWAMAVAAKIREETGVDVETLWGDDGFVVRFPDVDQPPESRLLLPGPDEVQALVVRQLGATALFAAKFRENAARSLLLPKRRPGMRAPLWQQRKRAADLLAVASRYGSFPVLLETYRECLRDFFDMPALISTLADIRAQTIRVTTVDSDTPSPFAASLLFSYVASFLYDGDAPLAERRAQALAVDQAQLRELLGDAELRELLDAESMEGVERQLQRLEPSYRAKNADAIHDMLIAIGDLSEMELSARVLTVAAAESVEALLAAGRILAVTIANEPRYIAAEDAARYRDGLGVVLPDRVADSLLQPVADPLGDLLLRYARTHAPFTTSEVARRYTLGRAAAEAMLLRLAGRGRLIEGEFRPGGTGREWTDAGVLRLLRRRSLAKLRHEIEPVEPAVLGRLITRWQGVARRRRGRDALLDAIDQLQGRAVARVDSRNRHPASTHRGLRSGRSRRGCGSWRGRLGRNRGAGRPRRPYRVVSRRRSRAPRATRAHGRGPGLAGARDPRSIALVRGVVLRAAPCRRRRRLPRRDGHRAVEPRMGRARHQRRLPCVAGIHTRHTTPIESPSPGYGCLQTTPARATFHGRSLGHRDVLTATEAAPLPRPDTITAWATSVTQQLLARHGIVTREAVAAESLPGGFATVYPVLKAMEENGRIRRGYFVAGLGATQFALPGALDLLRSLRNAEPAEEREGSGDVDDPNVTMLAASDPANPYGATLKWPLSLQQRWTQADPDRRRNSHPRRRRTRRLSWAWRSAIADLSTRQRTAAFVRRTRCRARASRPSPRRRRHASRHAARRNRRHAGRRPFHRALPRRGGILEWRHGLSSNIPRQGIGKGVRRQAKGEVACRWSRYGRLRSVAPRSSESAARRPCVRGTPRRSVRDRHSTTRSRISASNVSGVNHGLVC